MQAHIFHGYFDNGSFYTKDRQIVKIPERRKVSVTIFDEKVEAVAQRKRPVYGAGKGKMWIADDFDAPLEEMKEYME